MYKIKVKDEFAAAHRIKDYPGKCENLHGHNFAAEVEMAAKELNSLAMVIDFKVAKKMLKEVLDELDHKYLNEMAEFAENDDPTAERLAKYIFDGIAAKLAEYKTENEVTLQAVSLWESKRALCTYCRD